MTIYVGSRYQTATLDMVEGSDGTVDVVAFRGPSPLAAATSFSTYQVLPTDRLDALANRFYQRSDYWWVIADANPGVSIDPLPVGTLLRIPNVIG